jgi:HPt (histidine-containing phosphotransfer) domain-containing protein
MPPVPDAPSAEIDVDMDADGVTAGAGHEGGHERPRLLPVTWSPAAMIERLDGDDALARQLVMLFLGEYERLLTALRNALAAGRADEVRRAAHAAKGCLANFIEGGAQATAHQIEQLGAADRLSEVPALAAQLEDEVGALVVEMQAYERATSCAS